MSDLATLGTRFYAEGAEATQKAMDGVANAADRVEGAVDGASAATKRASSNMAGAASETSKFATASDRLAAEQEALIKTQQRLNAVHGSAVGHTNNLAQASLNLSRQLADISVQGAQVNANWGMIFIQQGPQIVDIFAQLKTQGIGFKEALVSMTAAARGLLVTFGPWLAGLALVVGAVWLAVRATEEHKKQVKALHDEISTQNKKLSEAAPWLIKTSDNAYLAAEGQKNFEKYLAKTNGTLEQQIKLMRVATIDAYKKDVADAQARQRRAQAEIGSLTTTAPGLGFTTGVGAFSTVSAAPSKRAVEQSNEYKAALKEVALATDNVRMATGLLNDALKVPKGDAGVFSGMASQAEKTKALIDDLLPREKAISDAREKRAQVEQALKAGLVDQATATRALAAADREAREAGITPEMRKAERDAESKAKAAQRKELAEQKRALAEVLKVYDDGVQASTNFADALLNEVAVMGMSSDQIKRRDIAMQAAAAPTQALADQILALGKQWEYQTGVMKAYETQQKLVKGAANDNIVTFEAATRGQINFSSKLEIAAADMEASARVARELRFDIEDFIRAIDNNDWATGFAGLLKVLDQIDLALGKNATSLQKMQALAGVGMGIGSAVGGKTGAGISGAASGALAGAAFAGSKLGTLIAPGIGTLAGAGIGAALGLVGSLLGSSSAKKKERESAAANAAAAEAQRLQTIADTGRSLEITLLRAQGKEIEAVAKEREDEIAKLMALSPALAETQKAIYAELDLADARTKEAEAARKDAEEAKARAEAIASRTTDIQGQIDELTKTSAELMYAGRVKELAAADALDTSVSELLIKLWGLQDAAAATAKATEEAAAAFEKAQAAQATNIGLMRQLNAMDDAILGTTSERDAQRKDELALLDDTGKYLQTIIWARQDEADRIAKQTAAMEAQAAKAAEVLKQRTSLENQLLAAIGRGSEATARDRASALKDLDPSLQGLQSALWNVDDASAAVTMAEQAVAEARGAATQAYERETSALQQTIDKFRAFSTSLRSFRDGLSTGSLAMNDPLTQYSRTKADFERVAGLAAQGNEQALGDLQGVSEAYLEASQQAQTTNVGYFRDLSAVKRATEAAQKFADQQVDQGTAQLNALNAQVAGLGIINNSVQSVGAAVGALAAAMDQLAKATAIKNSAVDAAKNLLNPTAAVDPKAGQIPIGANDNASLAAAKVFYNATKGGVDSDLFAKYFGSDPFGKSIGYTGDPEALRKKYGFATGGSFTVGGSGGPDSQFMPLHLTPGEMVGVTRSDSMADLASEMRALGARLERIERNTGDTAQSNKDIARNTKDSADTLADVSQGGDSIRMVAA